jgi:hypothetical protein
MQRRRRERISHCYFLNGAQDGNVVPQHPVDVWQACVGSRLEAFANACLPVPPLLQLVPRSVLIASDGAFSRFRLPGKASSCAEGLGCFS